jgi:hypothetical protein
VIEAMLRAGGFCLFAALSAALLFALYAVVWDSSLPPVFQLIVTIGAGGAALACAALACAAFDPY